MGSFYGFLFHDLYLKHFSYPELSTISHRKWQLPTEKATTVDDRTEAVVENGNSQYPLKWSAQTNDVMLNQPFIDVKIHRGTYAWRLRLLKYS